ncbi:stage II sporulation protein P [Paenibacillus glycanilyticus]|uniref:Stage II sporulation protein P n=1 Tax=Paenibacillus glycanilyticus TaxID=126569 RepID=A0ABQ6GE95_9BACL|nr:stage II sporulation protein P [Paenibacillus glycanilyticus]GLX69193.1 stage II sporulation protein P [Paenibacillus glycanilyticus]
MKKTIMLFDLTRGSKRIRQLLVTGKTFMVLAISSMLFFVAIGLAGMAHQHSLSAPVSSMAGFASSVSSGFFGDMLEMEMPQFHSSKSGEELSGTQISSFLLRLMTNVNPGDPRSLVAGEIPGMNADSSFLIRGGVATEPDVWPEDNIPIPGDKGSSGGDDHGAGVNEGDNEPDHTPEPPASTPSDDPSPTPTPTPDQTGGHTTGKDKVVFIYHSHSRESWYPEIADKDGDANSASKNITLVGERLAEKLEDLGVGTTHSDEDYPTTVPGYDWNYSYKYSKKTVQEAMASNKKLKFFFDIHRDSGRRKTTTANINGKSYAQVYFIIGHKNPDWKKNAEFATQIHEELEKQYPGLSRGILGKTTATGNGEYNQSLSDDSVLIEIGGVDNTLTESYRTADVLAKVIADIYWDAEKVSASK